VGVDAIGLAGQRRQALDALGLGSRHLPAATLQRIVHEARAVHRLDGGADRLAALIKHTHVHALP